MKRYIKGSTSEFDIINALMPVQNDEDFIYEYINTYTDADDDKIYKYFWEYAAEKVSNDDNIVRKLKNNIINNPTYEDAVYSGFVKSKDSELEQLRGAWEYYNQMVLYDNHERIMLNYAKSYLDNIELTQSDISDLYKILSEEVDTSDYYSDMRVTIDSWSNEHY